MSFPGAQFGQGGWPILLDDVACEGDEPGLLSCPASPFGIHDECAHSNDVGVACANASDRGKSVEA